MMHKALNFLKYNNAVPIILAVVVLGAGAAFAVSPELRQAAFAPETAPTGPPKPTDTTALRAVNPDDFDLDVRIDAITEDEEAYHVAYSYTTLEIRAGAWRQIRETGKIDAFREILGKRNLKDYLVEEIGEVIDRELAYLSEAQKAVAMTSGPKASSKYAALVGTEIDENDRKEAEKNGESQNETDEPKSAETSEQNAAASPTGLSREEINEMIVRAVSDFLAIETDMPEPLSEEESAETVPMEPASSVIEPGVTGTSSEETPDSEESNGKTVSEGEQP